MTDKISTGGPAFPSNFSLPEDQGMTLRDYFAAKAMHMAFEKVIHNWKQDGQEYLAIDFEFVAESAYLMADAMLKAREVIAQAKPAEEAEHG